MELRELKSGEDYNKEILKLIQKLNISEENVELYKTGFHDMKRERDKLIKDLEKLREEKAAIEMYLDAVKTYYPMYEEVSRKYNKLTEHIRLKALHNPSVSRYKDLMCFINEMEGDTHD